VPCGRNRSHPDAIGGVSAQSGACRRDRCHAAATGVIRTQSGARRRNDAVPACPVSCANCRPWGSPAKSWPPSLPKHVANAIGLLASNTSNRPSEWRTVGGRSGGGQICSGRALAASRLRTAPAEAQRWRGRRGRGDRGGRDDAVVAEGGGGREISARHVERDQRETLPEGYADV
jgi:hypothetical protein